MTHGHPDKYIYAYVFSSLPKAVIPSFTDSTKINSNSYLLLKANHQRARNDNFLLRAVLQSARPCPPGRLHLARQPSFSSLKLSRDKTQSLSFQGNYVSSALNAGKNTTSPPPCRETLGCLWTWTAQRILSQPRQPPGFRVHALCLWSLLHSLFSTAEAGSTPFWGLSFPKSVCKLALLSLW